MRVREDVFARVPHRQFVFSIPKRLRIYFRFDRKLLGKLPKIAFELIREVYQAVLGSVNAVPGNGRCSPDLRGTRPLAIFCLRQNMFIFSASEKIQDSQAER